MITASFTGRTFYVDPSSYTANVSWGTSYTYFNNHVLFSVYGNNFDTLVNFSANKGDTWLRNRSGNCDTSMIRNLVRVTDTGHVVISGQNLRKITTTYTFTSNYYPYQVKSVNAIFIERILNNSCHFLINSCGYLLLDYCFYQQNLSDYPNITFTCYQDDNFPTYPAGIDCNNILGLKENKMSTGTFSIFPNPTNDMLNFECILLNGKSVNLEISNSLGENVFQKKDFNISQGLDVSGLQSGVYFLGIFGNDFSVVKKMMKE